jgi:hypothetical protein
MGKRQACMNPQRPTATRYFPPQNSLSLSTCAPSLITWRSPHDIFMRQETSRGTRAQVRRFSTFPSSHQSVWSLSQLDSSPLHMLTSIPYILELTIATLISPCARNMIGIRTSLRCHYTIRRPVTYGNSLKGRRRSSPRTGTQGPRRT